MKENRNTIQKRLVLNAVRTLKNHPTANEVYNEVVKTAPNISRSTVYRNLSSLSQTGEIIHIKLPDGADCYDHRTDNHYHAHCRLCGRLSDVSMPYIADILSNISPDDSFSYESHSLIFTGVCKDCSE